MPSFFDRFGLQKEEREVTHVKHDDEGKTNNERFISPTPRCRKEKKSFQSLPSMGKKSMGRLIEKEEPFPP